MKGGALETSRDDPGAKTPSLAPTIPSSARRPRKPSSPTSWNGSHMVSVALASSPDSLSCWGPAAEGDCRVPLWPGTLGGCWVVGDTLAQVLSAWPFFCLCVPQVCQFSGC